MTPAKLSVLGVLFVGLVLSLGTVASVVTTVVYGQISSPPPPSSTSLSGAEPAEEPTMMDYENAQLGFSIQHPAAWIPVESISDPFDPQQEESATSTVSFVTLPEDPQDQFAESVSVIVDEMALSFSLDEYTAARLSALGTTFTDFNITQEPANVTLAGGRPAHQVIFDATLNSTMTGEPTIDGRVMEIWTIDSNNNNTVYTIHYEAEATKFDQFLTEASEMIESFTIIPTTTATAETQTDSSNGFTGAQVANDTTTTTTDSNMTTSAETPAASNASGLDAARQQFLSVWQETPFSSVFDTFIRPGSDQGYGVFSEHGSTVFNPDDTVTLYLEPVGFSHKEVLSEQGETLYQINLTASVQITSNDSTTTSAASSFNQTISDIPPIVIVSHRQNTELYMTIPLYLYEAEPPVPEGRYTIVYTLTDGETGQSFTIEKDITIAQTVTI